MMYVEDNVQQTINNSIALANMATNVGSVIGQHLSADNAHDIALQNLQFQKDNMLYNKGLQNRIFRREDNSIQRRVADLKAAGLSPVLAAGQGARAGGVVKVSPPQRDPSPEQMRLNAYGAMRDIAQTTMDMMASASQIRKTDAEANLIERTTEDQVTITSAMAQKALHENEILQETIDDVILRIKAEGITAHGESMVKWQQALWAQDMENYLTQRANELGLNWRISPDIIDYMIQEVDHDLRKLNLNLYTALGGTETAKGAIGMLQRIIPGILTKFLGLAF